MVFGAGTGVGRDVRFELEPVLHDIQQTLRVTGIDLDVLSWARQNRILQLSWAAIKANMESRGFEQAADRLRALGVHYANHLGRLEAPQAMLGESQAWQIRAALRLYHYLNSKLLLLTSALRLSLFVEGPPGRPAEYSERIERGVPEGMYPMERVSEHPEDPGLRQLFEEIKTELDLPVISSEYRTLALWPDYLNAVWTRLKRAVRRVEHEYACHRIRDESRTAAMRLPYAINFRLDQVRRVGGDPDAVIRGLNELEAILPAQILNIALISLDWISVKALSDSPFPTGAR